MRLGTAVLGDKPALIVWTHDASDAVNRNNYSFTAGFGDEEPSRKILVNVATFSGLGTTISGVTIGGVTPTLLITQSLLRLYIADVPASTSGTVTVSYSGAQANGCAIMVWATYGQRSSTPIDTAQLTLPALTASADLSVDTRSGGIVVAAIAGGANGTSHTWTGVTEDTETTSGINNWVRSGASANVASGQNPRTVGVSSSNASLERYALAASFR